MDEDDRDQDMEGEEEAQEHVLDPRCEFETHSGEQPDACRNKQTRYVHLIADEADKLRCGRAMTENYFKLKTLPKFLSPQCKQCFKHAASFH